MTRQLGERRCGESGGDELFGGNGWLRTTAEAHEGPAANQHFAGLERLLQPVGGNVAKTKKNKHSLTDGVMCWISAPSAQGHQGRTVIALLSTTITITIITIVGKSLGATVKKEPTTSAVRGPETIVPHSLNCPWSWTIKLCESVAVKALIK